MNWTTTKITVTATTTTTTTTTTSSIEKNQKKECLPNIFLYQDKKTRQQQDEKLKIGNFNFTNLRPSIFSNLASRLDFKQTFEIRQLVKDADLAKDKPPNHRFLSISKLLAKEVRNKLKIILDEVIEIFRRVQLFEENKKIDIITCEEDDSKRRHNLEIKEFLKWFSLHLEKSHPNQYTRVPCRGLMCVSLSLIASLIVVWSDAHWIHATSNKAKEKKKEKKKEKEKKEKRKKRKGKRKREKEKEKGSDFVKPKRDKIVKSAHTTNVIDQAIQCQLRLFWPINENMSLSGVENSLNSGYEWAIDNEMWWYSSFFQPYNLYQIILDNFDSVNLDELKMMLEQQYLNSISSCAWIELRLKATQAEFKNFQIWKEHIIEEKEKEKEKEKST